MSEVAITMDYRYWRASVLFVQKTLGFHGAEPGHARHIPCYPKLRRGQRRGAVQLPGTSAAHGDLCIRIAGLCYDTQHIEAMTFPVDIPDQTFTVRIDFSVLRVLMHPKLSHTPLVR